ncbi:MAG TPA: isopentenyl-diphosphate Delta-isomerase [Sporichthyaceae bacterium]|nr:isopentenyl-diphosphate Delta-isomerase [Sporichthyaceae bacterium]
MAVSEQVVLLDPAGRPCGVADKATVHGRTTPYHLAFSCYVFDGAGRFLVTQRAHTKLTWPGVWTNSCCGHPAPGEDPRDAVVRRLREELGIGVNRLLPALPDFSYRASFLGVEEHELCPVFLASTDAEPAPDRREVAAVDWWPWPDFLTAALAADSRISPWAQQQVRQLDSGAHVARFLAQASSDQSACNR